MSFRDWVPVTICPFILSQENKFPWKFYIGGHSKGGNLLLPLHLGLKEVDLANIANRLF